MIFLDTGAFLGKFIERDQYHLPAAKCWKEIEKSYPLLYTSNFVIDETLTLLSRRVGYSFASKVAHLLYKSSQLTILRPSQEDELEAIKSFEKLADQEVSFTDCISYALMRRNNLTHVFTFDRHFKLWKFIILPEN